MRNISKQRNVSSEKSNFSCKSRGAARARFVVRAKAIATLIVSCFVFLIGFIFPDSVAAFADGTDLTKPVKACIFKFEGYHMKDGENNLTGYGIEFLNHVSEYSHLNFKYVWYGAGWNWNKDTDGDGDIDESILGMLQNKEIDVVTSVSKTAEREAVCDFSLPIGRKKTVLSMREDDTSRFRGNYDTYEGMKIGLLSGNAQTQNAILQEFAENKFTYVTKEYNGDATLAEALQKGEVDAILSSSLRKPMNEKTLDVLEEDYFYAVVRKGDTELLKEINYAIEQMDRNEGDWQNVMFYKYYGPVYSSALTFTQREKDYIQKILSGEKKITATAYGNRAPYSYTENEELKGIFSDYFAKLMKLAATGTGVETLPYTLLAPIDNDDYLALANGGANIVLDHVVADPVKEDTVVNRFNTNSFMTARMAKVTRRNGSSEIKKVALAASQGADRIRQFFNEYEVLSYGTGEEAMLAVTKGEADVAYVYSYTAQYFINHGHFEALYYNSADGMSVPISMRTSENTDHELITILDKCIKQMPSDAFNQLAFKYTSYEVGNVSLGQYLKENPAIVVAIVVVVLLFVGTIGFLYLRGMWNRRLLRIAEQANKKMSEQFSIVEALSRDYANVYSIDGVAGTARIIKMEGYVVEGLKKGSTEDYNYAAILEKYIRGRVHPDDRQELSQALSLDTIQEKLKKEDRYMGSYRILTDGEAHHFQYAYFKLDNKEQEGEVILAGFRNIDELIHKEQEQKKVLSEALAQAQYANKAKTAFLNNMSHDIRTPMNAIIGFTSLAGTHLDNREQVRDYLGKIMTSGNHLLSLINDVLDMSRIESGKVKIEEKEVSLPEVMHDLRTIVQSDVKSKQLEFYIDTLDVSNETIICDKLRLNQVLLNLLSNAMKYTRPGGMVSVRVIQTADAPAGYASYKFCIKDTGIGMSKEFLKHAFEPFEREQTSTISGIQGTGLGLAITKNIVDLMGGTITVESEEGKGSEFIVTFCFKVADNSSEPQRLEHLENLKALVVDDDVNTCVSVSKMLSSIGMRPDWTTLGKEAVVRTKFALEQNEPYSAYVIDWLMPDMNGIELVRRIRKVIGNETPVIILTAYDWADIEKEAREAGVTAFCSKPLFLSELKSVLASPRAQKNKIEEKKKPELDFTGKKLLLVEDNALNQEIAQTILEAAGFVIDTADDGSIAVDKVKKMPAGTYDLILMDVQMPIMNGYDATRAIRVLDNAKKASIPIVAMTANAFEEGKKEAMDSGMNGFVPKPIDIEKLMSTLKDILQ